MTHDRKSYRDTFCARAASLFAVILALAWTVLFIALALNSAGVIRL